mmetsp:Transcript_28626/g.50896  ORF Transcript_28626/g.50896 Transcript_28626/m.50896 type:complete len:234 (+) Transcript_28626:1357-2058(+)
MYLWVAENFEYPLITFSIASNRSFSDIDFLLARIANIPASVHTLRMSAPVVFGQSRASSSKRMSLSMFIVFAWILKIWVRPSRSGRPNSTLRSNRPGLSRAGSSVSGLFVAIRTLTFPRFSNPSSWLTISSIVRWTSLSEPVPSSYLAPPTASTSSMNTMQAFFVLAIWKISRTILAPSPTYLCTSSLPMTLMKHASVRLATARAAKVLPVPGGPYNKTPLGGSMPRFTNLSG